MPTYVLTDASGNIVNRIALADPTQWSSPAGETLTAEPAGTTYAIGGTLINGVYTPPSQPPAHVPIPDITRRQFYEQLAVQNIITQAQAQAAVQSGTIPSTLQALLTGLPAAEQFPATMMVLSEGTFNRQNPVTIAIGTAFGMTSAQIDAFFVAAAAL